MLSTPKYLNFPTPLYLSLKDQKKNHEPLAHSFERLKLPPFPHFPLRLYLNYSHTHTHTHTILSHTLSLKSKPSIALHRELWNFFSPSISPIIPTLPPHYYWINQERARRCIHWWPPNWPIRSGWADFQPIGSSCWRTPT